jgi:hypothetical protein
MLRCRAIYAGRLQVLQRTSFQRITSRTDVSRVFKTVSPDQVAGPYAAKFRRVRGVGPRDPSILSGVHGGCRCQGSAAANVAEPIHLFILDDFANDMRAALAEPFERLVDVVHGEHDAEVAERIHWGVAMIRDDRRRDKPRELQSTVGVYESSPVRQPRDAL